MNHCSKIGLDESYILHVTTFPSHYLAKRRDSKQVADALGHSLDTHLLSYARFNTRELAKSFDQQPVLR